MQNFEKHEQKGQTPKIKTSLEDEIVISNEWGRQINSRDIEYLIAGLTNQYFVGGLSAHEKLLSKDTAVSTGLGKQIWH